MSLFLSLPDTALCEAVIEQIAAAKLGALQSCDTPQMLLRAIEGDKESIIIIDSDDKKMVTLIPQLAGKYSALLLLGDAGDGDGVTESFAKPLRLGHLITRLRYYCETAPLLRNPTIVFGPYRLEPQNRCLVRLSDGEMIRLTEKETALLVFLGTRNLPATRQEILAAVWGYSEHIDTHTLETHIYQLRRKIERTGESWLVNEASAYYLAEKP